MPFRLKTAIKTLCLCAALLMPMHAHAQEAAEPAHVAPPFDILPAKTIQDKSMLPNNGSETHPTLKLTPDKSELIRLDRPAASIIIGNPDNLSILADSAKTLVLVPKLPGATYITILDTKGDVLMQRHVIIAAPKERYIRIRKSCAGSGDDCQATQVYYCPGSCHEVLVPQDAQKTKDTSSTPTEGLAQQAQNPDDSEATVE